MKPQTIADALVAKYGKVEAYWLANHRVRIRAYFTRPNGKALTFWKRVRQDIYTRFGASEHWT